MLRRKGFTLIELLVVISIIALLISILLPSLKKARETAKMVTCSANVRQIVQVYAIYAQDFKDLVPLGWRNEKALNYLFRTNASGGQLIQFGYVYRGKYSHDWSYHSDPISVTEIFADPYQWPPETAKSKFSRSNYSQRPWSDEPWQLEDQDQPGGIGGLPQYFFPRLSELTAKITASDRLGTNAGITSRHIYGLNMGYGDGSVEAFRVAELNQTLDTDITAWLNLTNIQLDTLYHDLLDRDPD